MSVGTFFTKNEKILQTNRKNCNAQLWISSIISDETFSAFCNRVEAAGKTCHLCECIKDCGAEKFAISDQIVIGTTSETIREKVVLKY